MRPIRKLLCANRGEIAIRVFRACNELGIRTVAIYSDEDRLHEHRHKADEAYVVGRGKRPVEAYLGIDEILDIAQESGADAIHPGYGFLSENPAFARACAERGIRFVGPSPEVVALMGDKVQAKAAAVKAGVPVLPGITLDGTEVIQHARAFFRENAPILVKAANGGGGRGMRVVREEAQIEEAIASARSESKAAFGSEEVFLEKYLTRVRHIEVQIIGDLHGNLVHLGERDCSVQRRHQKVIEINARLQVEHTVTEQVTGVDLVQAQLRITEGHALTSPAVTVPPQQAIVARGFAVQCRVTTEDPANNFLPDSGTIHTWRTGTGFGIRLDAGNGYTVAHISSSYDSLLV